MTISEIREYLLDDLKVSVEDDVKPCLNIGSSRGGYFAVPRLFCSYIDFLGRLYRAGHEVFLRDICGTSDPNYRIYGKLLWEVYRNGLIHTYQPKTLQHSGHKISWVIHKGGRVHALSNGRQLVHIVPQRTDSSNWIQPISVNCLYQDLLSAIDQF